jgi:HD superfamily phosphohydrolase
MGLLAKNLSQFHQRHSKIQTDIVDSIQLPDGIVLKVNALEDALIKSSFIRRLGNIRQLGLAYLVFPGANHTRLEHSLGATYFATLMFDQLMNKYKNVLNVSGAEIEYYRQKLRIKLLAHDTGHAPGSHLFERASALRLNKFDHDHQTLVNIESDLFQNILKTHAYEWGHKHDVLEMIVEQIKDSVIDADKMDYLYRDALHCGIDARFDRNRLIDRLELHENKLAIEEGGVNAMVELIQMRRRMFESLYFNNRVSIYEKHLEEFLNTHLTDDFIEKVNSKTDAHIEILLEQNASDLHAQAILKRAHFKLLTKLSEGSDIKNEELLYQYLKEKIGESHILKIKSQIKPHSLTADNFFVLDKKYPPRPLINLRADLQIMKPEIFTRIYIHPDHYLTAKNILEHYQ